MELQVIGQTLKLTEDERIILSADSDKPMIFVGHGKESVDMYRGNFKIEDYVEDKIPLKLTGSEEKDGSTVLDFEGKITATVTVNGECAEIDSGIMILQ